MKQPEKKHMTSNCSAEEKFYIFSLGPHTRFAAARLFREMVHCAQKNQNITKARRSTVFLPKVTTGMVMLWRVQKEKNAT